MNTRGPFSLYDFLGYIVPGVVVIYLCHIFIKVSEIKIASPFLDKASNITFLGDVDHYIIFIAMAYIIGHVINYLSSITVEKFSIWMFDYPSNFLLKIENTKYLKRENIEEIKESLKNIPKKNFFIRFKALLIGSRFSFFRRIGQYKLRSSIWRIALWILILPISLLDCIIGGFFGLREYYTNQMDSELAEITIKKRSNYTNNNVIKNPKFDFQRILYHYYSENYYKRTPFFNKWITLFGFARSLSLIFSVSALLFLFYDIIAAIFFIVLAYVFFMAFMKFYRKFSLESYMCFITDNRFQI